MILEKYKKLSVISPILLCLSFAKSCFSGSGEILLLAATCLYAYEHLFLKEKKEVKVNEVQKQFDEIREDLSRIQSNVSTLNISSGIKKLGQ